MRREEARHLGIEIDQRHALDLRIAQHLAQRQPVAAAEDEHAARRRQRRQPRVHERLVVAVLVARAELQVRVEEQPQVVLPGGQHDALVGRGPREHHLVGVEVAFAQLEDALALHMPAPSSASAATHGACRARRRGASASRSTTSSTARRRR